MLIEHSVHRFDSNLLYLEPVGVCVCVCVCVCSMSGTPITCLVSLVHNERPHWSSRALRAAKWVENVNFKRKNSFHGVKNFQKGLSIKRKILLNDSYHLRFLISVITSQGNEQPSYATASSTLSNICPTLCPALFLHTPDSLSSTL